MYTLEHAVSDILDFNRLITSPQQRATPPYIKHCLTLFNEEFGEFVDALVVDDRKEMLDGFCDTLVTEVQYLDALAGGIDFGCIHKVLEFLTSTGYSLDKCSRLDMNVEQAISEVNRSNMTKVPTLSQVKEMYGSDVDEALKAASDYIETKYAPRYTGVTGKVVVDSYGVERVLFKDQSNKLMKPWCFEEPDLTPYLGDNK
jgi:hypothetical protein